MKARITYLGSSDINVRAFDPAHGEEFCFLLTALLGPEGADGQESFDFIVCSSSWMARKAHNGPVLGRFYLIVDHFDFSEITRFIEEYIDSVEGKDWNEVAAKISRIAHWEFEDIQPDKY